MDYELTRGHQSNVSGIKPTQDNHFDSNLSLIKDGDVIPEKDIKVEVDNLLRKDISDFFSGQRIRRRPLQCTQK